MPTFVRFLLVGGSATALQYGLLVAGVRLGLGPVTLVSGVAFLLSAAWNFVASRSFTFRSHAAVGPASIRYVAMIAVGLGLNTVVMLALTGASLHYLAAQVVATIAVMAWNYLASARWVFADGSR